VGLSASGRFAEYLKIHCPGLTDRERTVCSLIAIGMTSEGIGIHLGISINTVLTFRRLAYAKLKISSQAELLRVLF
jgi:LuxR family transcriptional regulator, activator of tox operons